MTISRNIWFAALTLVPGLALAHAHMEMSVPAANSTVASMPAQIMLHFSEATKLTAVSVEKADGSGKQELKAGTDAKAMFMIASPKLGAGVYVIKWRGLSDDSHVVNGTVKFTVSGK